MSATAPAPMAFPVPLSSRRAFLNPKTFKDAWPRPIHLLASASPEGTRKQLSVSRRAMACDFSLFFPAECRRPVEAGCAALDEVERLESKLSIYQAGSEISSINRTAFESPVPLDGELFALLQTAARLTEATHGAFDVATGALIRTWGFFRGPKRVPTEAEREQALASSGMAQVDLDPVTRTVRFRRSGLQLNLGSLGKGYAIDRALEGIRRQFGAHCVLMQGGQSSLKALGAPPHEPRGWKVAISHPCHPDRAVATVHLRNRALGTSGAANQYFIHNGRRYGHVLDPRTGWPADQLASASALAPSAAEADALSTAFFVMGVEPTRQYCRKHPEVSAVLVTKPQPSRPPEVILAGVDNSEVQR